MGEAEPPGIPRALFDFEGDVFAKLGRIPSRECERMPSAVAHPPLSYPRKRVSGIPETSRFKHRRLWNAGSPDQVGRRQCASLFDMLNLDTTRPVIARSEAVGWAKRPHGRRLPRKGRSVPTTRS